jgi:hypothetical protein
MRPMRSSGLSGRKAHARPSYACQNVVCGKEWCVAYHQKGCDDPVDKYAEENLLPDMALGEDLVETLVSNFAEDGIHHDEQTDS